MDGFDARLSVHAGLRYSAGRCEGKGVECRDMVKGKLQESTWALSGMGLKHSVASFQHKANILALH